MKLDRIIIQVSPEIRAFLNKKREQGFSINGYIRTLIDADRKKGKK